MALADDLLADKRREGAAVSSFGKVTSEQRRAIKEWAELTCKEESRASIKGSKNQSVASANMCFGSIGTKIPYFPRDWALQITRRTVIERSIF